MLQWHLIPSPLTTFQVRPATQRGGVLFAITDAHQKVVELGLALTPVRGGLQSILLYYTDSEGASHSRKAAAFSVPDMTNQWTRFTVSVKCKNLHESNWYKIRKVFKTKWPIIIGHNLASLNKASNYYK